MPVAWRVRARFARGVAILAAILASAAPAQDAPRIYPGADGRMLGHFLYEEAHPERLVDAPSWFGIGGCRIHENVARDLARLLYAAGGVPGIGGQLRGISCHRSVTRQSELFCGEAAPDQFCGDARDRARAVGPPRYSEHATGYAIDFGVRPEAGWCRDVEPCFANTPAGRWLIANATKYGFEMSFPIANRQGVTWEPWHWRWVGTSLDAPGAAQARATFAAARARFPAGPMIAESAFAVTEPKIALLPVTAPRVSRRRSR